MFTNDRKYIMDSNRYYVCFNVLAKSNLVVLLVLIVLKMSIAFISTDIQHGLIAECHSDNDLSTWHPYWGYFNCEGLRCNANCPSDCICKLGNFSEVISDCDGDMSVIGIGYPAFVQCLTWAHSNLHSIDQESLIGVADTLLYLNLHNNTLRVLEQSMFYNLINMLALDLRYNQLEVIESGTFDRMTHLGWLDLGGNFLTYIKSDLFSYSGSLSELYLTNNMLQEIQSVAFDNLRNLTSLDLKCNQIKMLQPNTLAGMKHLFFLNVGYNLLDNIHPNVFANLKSLRHLHLNNNNFNEVKSAIFDGLSQLKFLDLSTNTLKEIVPGAFTGLESLSTINLSTNALDSQVLASFKEISNISYIDLSYNKLQEIQSWKFADLTHLTYLDLSNNLMSKIDRNGFVGLTSLSSLNMANNSLDEIPPGIFSDSLGLSFLDLSSNMITRILPDTFNGLRTLDMLSLEHNKLTQLPHILNDLSRLTFLDVSNNFLEVPQPSVFRELKYLTHLYLENNNITTLVPSIFDGLISLYVLVLSNNPIVFLDPRTFHYLINLDSLLLQNINLQFLPDGIFSRASQLRHLDLSRNNIYELKSDVFLNTSLLETLVLTQNPLWWIDKDAFSSLNDTANVFLDNYGSCCFVTRSNCIFNSTMSPFLTCERLLPYTVLRVGIWIVSIFAIMNNILCLFTRCRYRNQVNKVQFVLITNLSISDFLMGVYLAILVSTDMYYTDYFPSHSESWRKGALCKIAGALSVLSSEASVFFITMISIDRAIAITFPFRTRRLGTKSTRIVVSVLWLTAVCISVTSFALSGVDSDIYAVPEICVGLPFSRHHLYNANETTVIFSKTFYGETSVLKHEKSGSRATMYFSIVIFTALNLCCFSIVGLCYTIIFISARKTTHKIGRSDSFTDIKMAKRMFPLVFTDFCCWVPIGVLSILVQAGSVEVNPIAYAWIATFILPINSSINPFLYTLGDVIVGKTSNSIKKYKWKKQNCGENVGFEMRTYSMRATAKSRIDTLDFDQGKSEPHYSKKLFY